MSHWPDGDKAGEFYVCTCNGHAIEAELLDWTRFGGPWKEVCLSLWGWADNIGKPGRLRQLWHVIRYGNPYIGAVCLTPDQARQFARELLAMVPEDFQQPLKEPESVKEDDKRKPI